MQSFKEGFPLPEHQAFDTPQGMASGQAHRVLKQRRWRSESERPAVPATWHPLRLSGSHRGPSDGVRSPRNAQVQVRSFV